MWKPLRRLFRFSIISRKGFKEDDPESRKLLSEKVDAHGNKVHESGYESFLNAAEHDQYTNENDEKVRRLPPDGGWGWVVVAASFLCLSVLDGISYTFGMFLAPLMKDMECGRGGVSTAGSCQIAVYSLTSIVASRLVTKYGPRPVCILGAFTASIGLVIASFSWNMMSLLISYSGITGIGFGLMYIPAVVAVAQHFTSKQSLAIGICVCGSGMGTFILAPIEHFLLSQVGWRWTFICMAGVCWFCILCGAAMKPIDQVLTYPPPIARERSFLTKCVSLILSEDLLASPALGTFLMIAAADCIASTALYIPFTFLPDEATSSGVSLENASFLIAAMGVSSSLGRVCSGWLCDRSWCNPALLTAIVVTLSAIPLFLFSWMTVYVMYLLSSCLFGFLTGVWIAATSPLLVNILGLNLLSPAFGMMTGIQGAAALTGPPLAGFAVDWMGNRGLALYMAGGIMSIAAIFYFIAYLFIRKKESKIRN